MKSNVRQVAHAHLKFSLFISVCAVVLCLFASVGDASPRPQGDDELEEVVFHEESNYDGDRLFISLGSGCYSMERDWDNRISSIDVKGHCIMAYEKKGCIGESVKLAPGVSGLTDLRRLRFNNIISSIRKCPVHRRKSSSRERTQRQHEIMRVGLQEHNYYRRMHGVPDLEDDPELDREAQGHADYLAKNNKFEVSPGKYGENLATSFKKDRLDAIRDVVKRWYDKIDFYNFRDPESNKNNPKSAQFSSIIWKETSHLGVGVAWNEADQKWVVVCMYSPPASMKNYRQNVPPPTKSMHAEAPSVFRTEERQTMGNLFRSRSSPYEMYE